MDSVHYLGAIVDYESTLKIVNGEIKMIKDELKNPNLSLYDLAELIIKKGLVTFFKTFIV